MGRSPSHPCAASPFPLQPQRQGGFHSPSRYHRVAFLISLAACLWLMISSEFGLAQTPAPSKPAGPDPPSLSPTVASPLPEAAVALNPEGTIYLDRSGGKLYLRTKVCLRDGVLEMLICPRQTKEHESILSLDGKAQIVHAGLLALGARPGHPAKIAPEYEPAAGDRIDIYVNWLDADGKPQRRRAQEWVRHSAARYFEAPLPRVPDGVDITGKGPDDLKYDDDAHNLIFYGRMTPEKKKELLSLNADPAYQRAIQSLFEQGMEKGMDAEFIFAGSRFHRRQDGTEVYMAEGGSLVCVANFGDATIDVNIQSTSSNEAGLLFEPWTERIPPVGSEVLVELIPAKSLKKKMDE